MSEAIDQAEDVVFEDIGLESDMITGELLPALVRLDRLLERAAAAGQAAFGPEAASDPYRGLYISPEEVERLLAREPG